MTVSCATCHTTHRIGADVPPGRVLSGRCKRCGAEIQVGADVVSASSARHSAAGGSSPVSLRSLAPTLPAPEPIVRDTDPSALVDEDAPASSSPRNAWCVDRGQGIDTMTTFELWVGLAAGQIHPASRVWREGMECWTPVEFIPEVACALVGAPDPLLCGAEEHAPGCAPSVDPLDLVARLGSDPLSVLDAAIAETPAGGTAVDVPTLMTPPPATCPVAPEARASLPPSEASPLSARRAPRRPWSRFTRAARRGRVSGGARWVALGSAVALTALALAASGLPAAGLAGRRPEPATRLSPTLPSVVAGVTEPANPPLAELAMEVAAPAQPTEAAPRPARPTPAPSHQDSGQRRLRRGPRP